jgi:hypothetical protein
MRATSTSRTSGTWRSAERQRCDGALPWLPVPVVPCTIEVAGARRQLLVAAPTGTPTAVLLTMHGSGSTPDGQVRLSRMAPLAEQGAVVAFPQGSIPLRAGWEWDLGSFEVPQACTQDRSASVSAWIYCVRSPGGGRPRRFVLRGCARSGSDAERETRMR